MGRRGRKFESYMSDQLIIVRFVYKWMWLQTQKLQKLQSGRCCIKERETADQNFIMKTCNWHLCENALTGRKIKYCSVKCKNKSATDRFRKNQKLKAVEYMGGCCQLCGYNKCVGALHFHHLDPSEKDFALSKTGSTYVWDDVKKELDKCVCLCGNCHSEVHAGIVTIPK